VGGRRDSNERVQEGSSSSTLRLGAGGSGDALGMFLVGFTADRSSSPPISSSSPPFILRLFESGFLG